MNADSFDDQVQMGGHVEKEGQIQFCWELST